MKVHVNYEVLDKNANDYIDYSNELDTILKNFTNIGEQIKTIWNSNNTSLYINSLNECVRRTNVDAVQMQNYGKILLGIKDDFKSKDTEYQQRFENDIVEGERL